LTNTQKIIPIGSSSIVLESSTNLQAPPEKWAIFAWAVRDAMSKASGLPKIEAAQREKRRYEVILGLRKEEDA